MIADLVGLAEEFFLFQLIRQATHRKGNTLDLLFCSNPDFLHSCNVTDTMFSDHCIVECMTIYAADSDTSHNAEKSAHSGPGAQFEDLNFFSDDTDWAGLDAELNSHDWKREFYSMETSEMTDRFIDICSSTAANHVPTRKRHPGGQPKSRIPRDRKNLMRRRRRICTQLRKTTSEARRKKLKDESRDVEKRLQHSYRQSQKYCEEKAVSAIKKNSKYFFSFANKFRSVKAGIGPLMDATKALVTSPMRMAEILSEQYSSVYSSPKEPLQDAQDIFPDEVTNGNSIHNVPFDEEDIIEAIDQISPTAAAGPDKFPSLLLKICKQTLAKPLFMIWKRSLSTGDIPQLLKTANVVPIHKGGGRGLPANYRPVALTSHLIKIFEKVLRKYLVAYMEENNLFNPGQHGFRNGRSCLSQLIAHFDHITHLLETGQNVDVVYLDFAKAFDKVDFMVTMRKLHNLGVSGRLGRWIHSFLTNRKQTVVVNGVKCGLSDVKSGVPQGSVLGPLLFLILIGDIDQEVVSAFVFSFADDTRAAKAISTEEDVKALQDDLQAIYRWSDDNNMDFNFPKFECLRYGRNNELKSSTHYYSKSGEVIRDVQHAKDLGVVMSSDGSFSKHISSVIETAKQMSGWVLGTFRTRDRTPMLSLWKSLIRSKLEYCCQLWCPSKTGDI